MRGQTRIINLEDASPRETWNRTSIILVPDFSSAAARVKTDRIEKKGIIVEKVKGERIHEGLSVQMLHVGSYSDEPWS